jgi:hypothetical protein
LLHAAHLTALCAQTQTKKKFESIASQRFQIFSCGSFGDTEKSFNFVWFKCDCKVI